MIAIRISKAQWGRAWRTMVDVAPVRLVSKDPVYEVLPIHLELLDSKGIAYEIIKPAAVHKEKRRRASSD